jgi:hypothetical protein
MPKSLRTSYMQHWREEQYVLDREAYLEEFANEFANKNRQSKKTVVKDLEKLINCDEGLLVTTEKRDGDTGTFKKIKRYKKDVNLMISSNCPNLSYTMDNESCNLLTDELISKFFKTKHNNAQPWAVAESNNDRFNIVPSEATYLLIQQNGVWIEDFRRLSSKAKKILCKLIKSIHQQFYERLPSDKKAAFKRHFCTEMPHDIFLNYYPLLCNAVGAQHKDNVIYGATVTQLTPNNEPGLFVVPGDKLKTKYPLPIARGNTICLFSGVVHEVLWQDQPESRMTLV